MPPGKADISIALVGASTTTRFTLARAQGLPAFERTTGDPLNPIVNISGELDYRILDPRRGITWDLHDFSKGLGGFNWEQGYYLYGRNVDTRWPGMVFPGPKSVVDLTGIALNEKVVRAISYNGDNYIATSTTVYRSTSGTGNWTEIGANGAAWAAGNPTDIIAFPTAGGVSCIAVAMGSSVAFQYTVDGGTNWITSTRAGNAKYANYFCNCAAAGTAPVVK